MKLEGDADQRRPSMLLRLQQSFLPKGKKKDRRCGGSRNPPTER